MLEFGYVRLYRSLLNWEWYTDSNTKDVFIHLILTANYEPKKWRGKTIERGQRVASYASLASELKLSVKSVRTALNHLKSTGEVAILSNHEYSIITIKNYESYQDGANQTANLGQSEGKPRANEGQQCKKAKESNKARNKKNIYIDAFASYAAGDSDLLNALEDFAEMRKAKKKPISTIRTVNMLLKKLDELADNSQTKIKILEQSIFHNWDSVFPLKGDENNGRNSNGTPNNDTRSAGDKKETPKYGHVV